MGVAGPTRFVRLDCIRSGQHDDRIIPSQGECGALISLPCSLIRAFMKASGKLRPYCKLGIAAATNQPWETHKTIAPCRKVIEKMGGAGCISRPAI
jgi:hypothetical protein